MSEIFDVIIIGSGPAGTSAAYPLLEAGLKVMMIDPEPLPEPDHARAPTRALIPESPYLQSRFEDPDQWEWMLGRDFHSIHQLEAISPKLRTPSHAHIFKGYMAANKIATTNFAAIGSLATGGLSNSWGCGVARLQQQEFQDLDIDYSDFLRSYKNVALRMGISGGPADDLSDYFGVGDWEQPALPMDDLHQSIYGKYAHKRAALANYGFKLGRSRVAVLSRPHGTRQACNISGNCLWGCRKDSLYNASFELPKLKSYPNFTHQTGGLVTSVVSSEDGWIVQCQKLSFQFFARKILFAAGTLSTTALVLKYLGHKDPVRLLSSPTAAFLAFIPHFLGVQRTSSFGLGQLSYSVRLSEDVTGFGSTFSTSGLPVSEFVNHIPFGKNASREILRRILTSCVVGNMFLPGQLSDNNAFLNSDGTLVVQGGVKPELGSLMKLAESKLRKSYMRIGAFLIPMSFKQGMPGSDIHYAGTLPMRSRPGVAQTSTSGEVFGMPGAFVVDGASLPVLTEKSHTMTIMANADRISRKIVASARIPLAQ